MLSEEIMDRYDKLVVISSPSGGGKGTLVKMLLNEFPNIWFSVSATTRSPREGEVDGVDYYFLSRDEFMNMVAEDGFLEWAEFSGNCYGTPRKYIDEHLDSGEIVLLEIEVQGATNIMNKCPGCHTIFIQPPSMEVLEERLRGRGTDSEESIQKRLAAARGELEHAKDYEKVIVNDNLDVAFSQLKEYIKKLA